MVSNAPLKKELFKEKKVFILEDDRFLHDVLVDEIRKWGAETASAYEGESAVEKIREADPDIIILDIILPGIDGFTVLSKLQADADLKSIPVVILSNLGQKEDIEKGMRLGAKDFLVKAELTFEDMMQKIGGVLKKEKEIA